MTRILTAVLLCTASYSFPSAHAYAQVESAFRLTLESNLLHYSRFRQEIVSGRDYYYDRYNRESDGHSITSGAGSGATGFPASLFAIGVGYGLSEHLVVGANLHVALASARDKDGAVRQFGVGFAPYLNFVFGRGIGVRPFVGLIGNTTMGSYHAENYDQPVNVSLVAFGAGPQIGLHWLVTNHLSIDIGSRFLLSTARMQTEQDYGSVRIREQANGFDAQLFFGASGWFTAAKTTDPMPQP